MYCVSIKRESNEEKSVPRHLFQKEKKKTKKKKVNMVLFKLTETKMVKGGIITAVEKG